MRRRICLLLCLVLLLSMVGSCNMRQTEELGTLSQGMSFLSDTLDHLFGRDAEPAEEPETEKADADSYSHAGPSAPDRPEGGGKKAEDSPREDAEESAAAQDSAAVPESGTGGESAASQSYFDPVYHADIAYGDMVYEEYRAADFRPYAEAIAAFAENGGTLEEFQAADNAARAQIEHVYTLSNLIDLKYYADPTDDEVYTERLRINAVLDDAYDSYMTAMGEVANSGNSKLLKFDYADWQIDTFSRYVPDEDAGDPDEGDYDDPEAALEQEYYSLFSASSPDYEAIAEVYVELVKLRKQIAVDYGYDSYAAYAYENFYYRSYEPGQSEAFWAAVKENFVPLMEDYGYDIYWALDSRGVYSAIDASPETILAAMEQCLPQMSEELDYAFHYMLDYGLYNLDDDPDKSSVGFTTDLYEYNEPFIFNSPYGDYNDYYDSFHEFGHFTNAFYTESDLVFGAEDYDLAELQSQGMEMMFTHFYDEIFGEEYSQVLKQNALMSLIYGIIDGALYDEFQQKVFAEEDLDADRVCEIFKEVYSEYGYARYSGYEWEWAEISHNFDDPFYYISYALSAVSALELFTIAEEDYEGAMDVFLRVCAMSLEDFYFTDALEEVGLSDVFDISACRRIAAALEPELSASGRGR